MLDVELERRLDQLIVVFKVQARLKALELLKTVDLSSEEKEFCKETWNGEASIFAVHPVDEEAEDRLSE